VSGEQLPAVNTWFKLREIIILICTMATPYLKKILVILFRGPEAAILILEGRQFYFQIFLEIIQKEVFDMKIFAGDVSCSH
jgi:hypothetical protein